ncbi:hypothetical protein FRC07_003131 [Ceratobasidium sp. 392]|nr:hypothetical protein FRC07_003131 [Ceratobasidium sp. 392]
MAVSSTPTPMTPLPALSTQNSQTVKRRANLSDQLPRKKATTTRLLSRSPTDSNTECVIDSGDCGSTTYGEQNTVKSPSAGTMLQSPIRLRGEQLYEPVSSRWAPFSTVDWRQTNQVISSSSPPSSPTSAGNNSTADVSAHLESDKDIVMASRNGPNRKPYVVLFHNSDEEVDVIGFSDSDEDASSGEKRQVQRVNTDIDLARDVAGDGVHPEDTLVSAHPPTPMTEYTSDVLDLTSDEEPCEDETSISQHLATSRSAQQDAIEYTTKPGVNIMDDTETIERSVSWNTKALSSLEVLNSCLTAWNTTCDWNAESDANPIWDILNSPLMAEHVMDHIAAYLVHSSSWIPSSGSKTVCFVPSSLFGAVLQFEDVHQGTEAWSSQAGPGAMARLISQRSMVWTSPNPPKLVLIPVINRLQAHCYLWFGYTTQRTDTPILDLELSLADSLSRPSDKEFRSRLASCTSVLRFLLPQINGAITGCYADIPGFRQAPGSTDCGYFVCQAMSALAYNRKAAMYALTPVSEVKQHALEILQQCRNGVLEILATGHGVDSPVRLHLDPQPAPPPWLLRRSESTQQISPAKPPNPTSWVTPRIERSLSEPPGDGCRQNLDHGTWEEVFGPRVDVIFEQVSGEAFRGYLEAASAGGYNPPRGLLAGVGAQLPQSLMKALLLDGEIDPLNWAPEAILSDASDEDELEDPAGGAGLRRFLQGLASLNGGLERNTAILTGEHFNETLHLNWAKETVDISEDWLTAGLDIDSLSLTASDPKFTSPVVVHAYPSRSGTLTTDNGLSVDFNGRTIKLSHIPNFVLAHVGPNNQFRINAFFPGYNKGQNNAKQYITICSDADHQQFYEEVFLQALIRAELRCPREYRHAATSLRQELPSSYANAKAHASQGGNDSKGYKILPELFNLILDIARQVIDRAPRLQKFKGFFLHVWGTNLKHIGHEVSRSDGNAMLHVLKSYPIVDWSLQNPRDIVVDVGLEINVRPEMLPSDVDSLTLLWRLSSLKRLARPGWRKANVDAYMHSHVVGGISARPRAAISSQFYYMHAYMKDKVVTYRHRDSSIGTGFSPQDGLSNSDRYVRNVGSLGQALTTSPGSFGCRQEMRCGVWATKQILDIDSRIWVQRYINAGAIIAHRTSDVVKLKMALLGSYEKCFSRLQLLPASERSSESALLLASILTYLSHGIVQRPNDMSSSRYMAKNLEILDRARRFGFASVPANRLSDDLLGMSTALDFGSYKILDYSARKNPAGARIKPSRLPPTSEHATESAREHATTSRVSRPTSGAMPVVAHAAWAEELVNQTLASWIWGRMNEGDKARGVAPNFFHGPLVLSRWQTCVDTGVKFKVRAFANGFDKALANFIPTNWVLSERGRIWQTLQIIFLDQVIDHIAEISPEQQNLKAQKRNSRRRPVGYLIPDVLFNHESVDTTEEGTGLGAQLERDSAVDLLCVVGTSLKTEGAFNLVRHMSRCVRANGGAVLYVDKRVAPKKLATLMDMHFQMNIDVWSSLMLNASTEQITQSVGKALDWVASLERLTILGTLDLQTHPLTTPASKSLEMSRSSQSSNLPALTTEAVDNDKDNIWVILLLCTAAGFTLAGQLDSLIRAEAQRLGIKCTVMIQQIGSFDNLPSIEEEGPFHFAAICVLSSTVDLSYGREADHVAEITEMLSISRKVFRSSVSLAFSANVLIFSQQQAMASNTLWARLEHEATHCERRPRHNEESQWVIRHSAQAGIAAAEVELKAECPACHTIWTLKSTEMAGTVRETGGKFAVEMLLFPD